MRIRRSVRAHNLSGTSRMLGFLALVVAAGTGCPPGGSTPVITRHVDPSAVEVVVAEDGDDMDGVYIATIRFRSVFGESGSTDVEFLEESGPPRLPNTPEGAIVEAPDRWGRHGFEGIQVKNPNVQGAPIEVFGQFFQAMESDKVGWTPIGICGVRCNLRKLAVCYEEALINNVESVTWDPFGHGLGNPLTTALQGVGEDVQACRSREMGIPESGPGRADDPMGSAAMIQVGIDEANFGDIASALEFAGTTCQPSLVNYADFDGVEEDSDTPVEVAEALATGSESCIKRFPIHDVADAPDKECQVFADVDGLADLPGYQATADNGVVTVSRSDGAPFTLDVTVNNEAPVLNVLGSNSTQTEWTINVGRYQEFNFYPYFAFVYEPGQVWKATVSSGGSSEEVTYMSFLEQEGSSASIFTSICPVKNQSLSIPFARPVGRDGLWKLTYNQWSAKSNPDSIAFATGGTFDVGAGGLTEDLPSFNRWGGAMSIERYGEGFYEVNIPNLGHLHNPGLVVSPRRSGRCKIGDMDTADQTVTVLCHDTDGVWRDSDFSFVATSSSSDAYAHAFNAYSAPAYVVPGAHNPTDGRVIVDRWGVGGYSVRFEGMTVRNALVTGDHIFYGAVRCKPYFWAGETVEVICRDQNGTPADSSFYIVATEDTEQANYARFTQIVGSLVLPDEGHSHWAYGFGMPMALRTGVGKYRIIESVRGAIPEAATPFVSAYNDFGDVYCQMGSETVGSEEFETVRCRNSNGDLRDADFAIRWFDDEHVVD